MVHVGFDLPDVLEKLLYLLELLEVEVVEAVNGLSFFAATFWLDAKFGLFVAKSEVFMEDETVITSKYGAHNGDFGTLEAFFFRRDVRWTIFVVICFFL